ncbi:ABC transporter ATP-binding protein [Devriesea agamarum]|uniref:ABC transporter ATP-binding protein n=1 Tax=Devriesea agamarum TaxID=472569 RepID=UPI00071DBFF4|nr:ABC transporter ATP-binding protein [Devriesea agamarum]
MRPTLQLPDTPLEEGQIPDHRRILRLFAPYRARLLLVVGLIAVGAAAGVLSPFLIREIVDDALPHQNLHLLLWCVLGLIGVAVIAQALTVVQSMLSTTVGQAVMHDLRVSVYAHLQRLSLAFFTRTRTGEVQSRISNDIGGMQAVVTNVMTQVVSAVAGIVVAIVAMLALDWRLTIFSLITVPIAVFINRRIGKRRRSITKRRQEKMAEMTSGVQESLSVSGILLGRTMGRTEPLINDFAGRSHALATLEIASEMSGRWMMAAAGLSLSLIPALTYLLGGYLLVGGDKHVTIGTLVAFVALQMSFFSPMNNLMRVGVQINASLALFTRVFEYLDVPISLREKPDALALDARQVRGDLRCEGVGFTYPGSATPTLSGLDLHVPPGGSIALVGATGSGKTTTGYLLARMYDPTQGRIMIDGHDVRDLTFASLADCIGVVSQETYLLHDTIAANLRFARPDATDEDLERACRIAQIHDYIASLPDGYNTVVGERGYRFSGGEKQRLAIARTVLRDPPILLLDEATSSLDVATERAMSSAIAALSEGRTTVTIAHRLSTVRDADEILVLDKGRVAERGTYDHLLAAGGIFTALVHADRADAETSP